MRYKQLHNLILKKGVSLLIRTFLILIKLTKRKNMITIKKMFFIIICCVSANITPNMNINGFGDFPNYYFVETGLGGGGSLQSALRSSSFSELHSMEIDINRIKSVSHIFESLGNIFLHHGDSGKDLWDLIKTMDKPITFWLDGHLSYAVLGKEKNTPLLEELEQIKRHPLKSHTILIDDIRLLNTPFFDNITTKQLIAKIQEINPNYTIYYIDGHDGGKVLKNDVMVAQIFNTSSK